MNKLSSLSIFFPCYNDAKSMPYLIAKANDVAQKIANTYELIVINDGSKDESKAILTLLKKTYPYLKVIHHSVNKGYGAALITGFKNSKKDWVFYTDGDGQYDPTDLLKLISYTSKFDVINGYKLQRSDSWIRRLIGTMYNRRIQHTYHPPIRDIDCDFRLIRKSFMKKIVLKSTSATICLELVMQLQAKGARFKEVGIPHYPRLYGRSQFFNFTNVYRTYVENLHFKQSL